MADEWCKGSALWALPTLIVWKLSENRSLQAQKITVENRMKCPGGMFGRAWPARSPLSSHPQWAQSFRDGSHPDLHQLTFCTYTIRTQPSHLRWLVQGPNTPALWVCGHQPLIPQDAAAGWLAGSRPASLSQQFWGILLLEAGQDGGTSDSTQSKEPISVQVLKGLEMNYWDEEWDFNHRFAICLLDYCMQFSDILGSEIQYGGLYQQAEAGENEEVTHFHAVQCSDTREIWQWPC